MSCTIWANGFDPTEYYRNYPAPEDRDISPHAPEDRDINPHARRPFLLEVITQFITRSMDAYHTDEMICARYIIKRWGLWRVCALANWDITHLIIQILARLLTPWEHINALVAAGLGAHVETNLDIMDII